MSGSLVYSVQGIAAGSSAPAKSPWQEEQKGKQLTLPQWPWRCGSAVSECISLSETDDDSDDLVEAVAVSFEEQPQAHDHAQPSQADFSHLEMLPAGDT